MLRPKLNRIWASTSANTRRDPGDTKYIQGWVSEIPTYQVLNYLQYKIDTTLLALAERGFFEWGSDVQYGLGSVVWDETTKKIYVATVGSPNRTKAPSTNLTQWAESSIQIPRANYDTAVAAINAHIADVTGNPHRLTAGRLNAYNKAEIDSIVVTYRNLVSAHAQDKSNPHAVTALQVGAVPVTGGTYTGDVTFNGGLYFDSGKVNQISKSNGLFLQSGSFILGINSGGKAVTGTTSSQSPIVTEQTFPDLKETQEAAYAVPIPTHEQKFIGDINTYTGISYITTNIDPGFIPTLGYVLGLDNGSTTFSMNGDTTFTNTNGTTIAIDLYESSDKNSDTSDSVYLGVRQQTSPEQYCMFVFTGSGQIRAQRALVSGGNTLYSNTRYQIPSGEFTWRRFVATFNGNTIKLFMDGAMVASITNGDATASANSGVAHLQVLAKSSSDKRFWRFRNFRMWNSELTDKQISTL